MFFFAVVGYCPGMILAGARRGDAIPAELS